MTSYSDRPDVVGSAEIQRILGVSRARVHQLAQRADFPPYTELAIGRVYDRKAILAWEKDRRAPASRNNARQRVLARYRRTGIIQDAAQHAGVSRRTARRWLSDLGALNNRP